MISDLDKLAFQPQELWFGWTYYSWKGHDGTLYSRDSVVLIKISFENVTFTVVDSRINGIEDKTIYFKNVYFTQNLIDANNNSLEKI